MFENILKAHKWQIIVATILSMSSASAIVILISHINEKINDRSTENVISDLLIYVGGVIAMIFMGLVAHWFVSKLNTSVTYRLRDNLIRRIMATSYDRIESMGAHSLHATLTADVSVIAKALEVLPAYVFNTTILVVCCIYMATLSMPHFLIVLGVILCSMLVTFIILKRNEKVLNQLRDHHDELYKRFNAVIFGSKELALNSACRHHFHQRLLDPTLISFKKITEKDLLCQNINESWNYSAIFIVLGIVAFVFGWQIPVSNEVKSGFVLVLIFGMGSVNFVVETTHIFINGVVSYRKVLSLALDSIPIEFDEQYRNRADNWQRLTLDQVSYRYASKSDGQTFEVGPVSYEFNAGEVIFIAGENGSGKSSFIKVLNGLYTPSAGNIYLDGVMINSANQQWYRDHFCSIFTDFYLFDFVIDKQGNLADDAEVQSYLDKLHLADVVTVTGGVLSSIDLSQGQKKRLALLMAYIQDSPIFIFDEWAANQSPQFREHFYENLLPELKSKGKTVFVISHDDCYFDSADTLLKFDCGQLVQSVQKVEQPILTTRLKQGQNSF